MATSETHNDDHHHGQQQLISERDFADWLELQGMSTETEYDFGESYAYDSVAMSEGDGRTGAEPLLPSQRKRSREANRPPRPLSAYNLFFKATHREMIEERGSSVSFAAMGKLVGKKWRGLSKKERKVWIEKADVQSEKYHEALQAHRSSLKAEAGQASIEQKSEAPESKSKYHGANTYKFTAQSLPIHHHSVQSSSSSTDESSTSTSNMMPCPLQLIETSLSGAVDLTGQLPRGFEFPQGLPPTGSAVPFRFPDGTVRECAIEWKVYTVKASQANSFLHKIGEELSRQPFPMINEQKIGKL
mmetsp:Transcript_27161/g.62657  ORF Transcript_27161/g.62657 Transcript_27161/m.62657 type:complete len:302 (-) Transcript_27161:1173-2078(-)